MERTNGRWALRRVALRCVTLHRELEGPPMGHGGWLILMRRGVHVAIAIDYESESP